MAAASDARHTNAITAHEHLHGGTRLIEHRGVHRGAVLASELKDVADSMPRTIWSVPCPVGLGSPATTLRRSAAAGSGSPGPSSRRCSGMSFSLAPQTKSADGECGVIGNYAHALEPTAI